MDKQCSLVKKKKTNRLQNKLGITISVPGGGTDTRHPTAAFCSSVPKHHLSPNSVCSRCVSQICTQPYECLARYFLQIWVNKWGICIIFEIVSYKKLLHAYS
ncbi:hypothetical protein DM860_001925 [Cuscuta australis]|uniref:Uncharacterized protein n=1 Tax=Cuscuta australis TaxID=267555 RepID=A0A328DVA6_9ASTE|nr:hypothetical protein DM860_001925 [Cuscuta australis]